MSDQRVEIYQGGGGEVQAQFVRSILEAEGIEAVLSGAGTGGAYPVNVGYLAEFKVYVWGRDAERAAQILDEALAGDDELAEDNEAGDPTTGPAP